MINYLQNTGKPDEISFVLFETDRNTQIMQESCLVLKNDSRAGNFFRIVYFSPFVTN